MESIEITWSNLKSLKVSKNLPFQYTEDARQYRIWIQDGAFVYTATLYKDSSIPGVPAQNTTDRTDWETNFKAAAGQRGTWVPEFDDKYKTYNATYNIAASPVTLNVKTDLQTKYGVSNAVVRFMRVRTTETLLLALNGDSETIRVRRGEIFILNEFFLTSATLTILTNGTEVDVLVEGR